MATANLSNIADIPTEGSVINDISKWENSIYLIDEQDYVHGGEDGYDNIPHQQLANRTLYLKDSLHNVSSSLDLLASNVSSQNIINDSRYTVVTDNINDLRTDLDNLFERVTENYNTHDALIGSLRIDVDNALDTLEQRKFYAGSDSVGGAALRVHAIYDNKDIHLVGLENNGDSLIRSNVVVKNDEITANIFHGMLDGIALNANRLSNNTLISLYGDVLASYHYDGSTNVQVRASLKNSGVSAGSYGPDADKQLGMNDTFIVPAFTVDEKGIITSADVHTFTLPDEAVSGTTNATQNNAKLYIVGAPEQNQQERTYSNNQVYMNDGILYSNGTQVVTVSDSQDLTNKTYEGFRLHNSVEHDVDNSIQGIDGSDALVTSNALFNHKHNYAGSDTQGGHALTVKMSESVEDEQNYLLVGNIESEQVKYNNQITVNGNDFTSPVIHATVMMHIPGGRLWIDTSAHAIDGSDFFNKKIEERVDGLEEKINESIVDIDGVVYRATEELRSRIETTESDIESINNQIGTSLADTVDTLIQNYVSDANHYATVDDVVHLFDI